MFTPYRGDRWAMADNAIGGVRLLILGESHYSGTDAVGSCDPNTTLEVVGGYLDGSLNRHSKRFFTKLGHLVSRKPVDEVSAQDIRDVWDAVMFYNYVPAIAASGPRQAPPEHLWGAEAAGRFLELVRRAEVEAVLVCGQRLWHRMPAATRGWRKVDGPARVMRFYEYEAASPYLAVAAPINHPSSPGGWTAARWRPVVDLLFEEVATQRSTTGQPAIVGSGVGREVGVVAGACDGPA